MRVETIGPATLYLADMVEAVPALGRVDHVITDPPYEAEAHTHGRRRYAPPAGAVDAAGLACSPLPFAPIAPVERAALARFAGDQCDGWAIAFCQIEAVATWRAALESAGASYRRALIWHKIDSAPQFTGDRPGMGYETMVAAWCRQGRSAWNGGGRRGVFVGCGRELSGKAPHPTTKPQWLMRELVALFTAPDQLIADPFMGSGSTGVAALSLGRRFVGVERDPAFFEIARRRIEDALRQPRLFGEPPQKSPAPAGLFE